MFNIFMAKPSRILSLNTLLKGYYTFMCNVIDVVALQLFEQRLVNG